MTNLPKISTLWIGPRLSWFEQLCLKSFADRGHHVTLYSYAPIDNIPAGVHAKDAEDIFPQHPMLRHARTGSPAIHADIWRLNLLKKTDEIWVDTDMYCYRPFDFETPFVYGFENSRQVCNAVLGLPKDSKTLDMLFDFFSDKYAIAPWLKPWRKRELQQLMDEGTPVHFTEQSWGFTGPESVTHFLRKSGEIEHACPEPAFYPVSFQERNFMIKPGRNIASRFTEDTRGIHFWARRMKPRLQEKENNVPRAGSFMARLIDEHEIIPADAPIPPRPVPKP